MLSPTIKTISLPLLSLHSSNLAFYSPQNHTDSQESPTSKMPKTHLKPMNTLFILLIFLHTHFKNCNGVSASGFNSLKTASELDEMMRRVCGGGECIEEIDSESNRRVLVMQRRFISYETLKRDLVPCTRPGASYYNCRAAGAANPYNRGCEVITGCARDISDIKS